MKEKNDTIYRLARLEALDYYEKNLLREPIIITKSAFISLVDTTFRQHEYYTEERCDQILKYKLGDAY